MASEFNESSHGVEMNLYDQSTVEVKVLRYKKPLAFALTQRLLLYIKSIKTFKKSAININKN